MPLANKSVRITQILQTIKDVEDSPLSVKQYFKQTDLAFGRAQYYLYKKAIEKNGIEGLSDGRSKGNHIKFTTEIQNYVKGLLESKASMNNSKVQCAIKSEFGVAICNTTIKDFRRKNNLNKVRPTNRDRSLSYESGASEIIVALALGTGLIDTIANSIYQHVQKKKESIAFKNSFAIQKDHPNLRSKGKFTSEYNNSLVVRESRFKPIEEKVEHKRFASMNIFSLSKNSIMRHALALISLPLVTNNGRVRSVDNPRGNALKYLCGFNYKASTLDKHQRELKYLQLSNELIEATAKFWIDFWGNRNKSDNIFACYYIDGNTKALWSSKPCHKGKVTMLGRVMNCLEQVFVHDGQGRPIYYQTFNGHADLGKNALKMMDKISGYLQDSTTLEGQFSVNKIMIMDAGANGVKTLREISDSKSGYYFITILDSNQVRDRNIKSVSKEKRYEYGDAYLVDCTIELEDSNDKGYIFETRAVQVRWDNGRSSALITNLPESLFSTDNVVKSYFDRWPLQELDFRNMKSGVNIHRIVGYGKKLVDDTKVLEKIERLQEQVKKLETELEYPLNEIRVIEEEVQPLIEDERTYREKSKVENGARELSEADMGSLQSIQKDINRLERKIKKIKKSHEKSFIALKNKKGELARIVDKKKIYRVDLELDQIMTSFKISFANICAYLLDECFDAEKMSLERLIETIFELRGKGRCKDGVRTVSIESNPKQKEIRERLDSALDVSNSKRIDYIDGRRYEFKIV